MTPSGFHPGRTIHVHPTTRCNLACRHCYSSSSPQSFDAVPLEQLARCLELLRHERYEVASLSGGEPLMYRQIRALALGLKALDYRIHLVTNGSTLSRAFDDVVDMADVIAVSFDGGRDLHNEIRGSATAFDHAIRGLEYLRSRRRIAAMTCCVTRRSLPDVPHLADIALAHGVAALQLRPLVMTGRARMKMSGDELDDTHLNRLFLTAVALQQELGESLRIHLDLVHTTKVGAHREQYRALLSDTDHRDLPLSDLVNPIVITADGSLRPLTYGFDSSFDIGAVADIDAATISAYKFSRIGPLRDRIAASFEDAAKEDRFVDWFAYCANEWAASRGRRRTILGGDDGHSRYVP